MAWRKRERRSVRKATISTNDTTDDATDNSADDPSVLTVFGLRDARGRN
jgi:hypothetical protein